MGASAAVAGDEDARWAALSVLVAGASVVLRSISFVAEEAVVCSVSVVRDAVGGGVVRSVSTVAEEAVVCSVSVVRGAVGGGVVAAPPCCVGVHVYGEAAWP